MAKPKQTETTGKEYTPRTGKKFDTLKVGDAITGVFIGARMQTITDKESHLPKELFVIKIRDAESVVRYVPCAAMMLQAWDEIVDDYGNGDERTAIHILRGKSMTIKRGEDSATKGGNQLGQYTLIVGS